MGVGIQLMSTMHPKARLAELLDGRLKSSKPVYHFTLGLIDDYFK
jgi:hypothetical protein